MSFYTLIGLRQEPFSNSPDPDLLYRSPDTARCLHELEIAVRLHRGLNVVFGPVGTGKTTICRELLRQLHNDPHIRTFLILDPGYVSQLDFVRALGSTLGVPSPQRDDLQAHKDGIQNWLLTRVNAHEETVILLIDEGQKIRDDCLEILRELLNFETNTAKLLQIVLFAQTELKPRMQAVPNLMDRINLRYELGPLNLTQTRAMIEYRLAKSRLEESQPIRLTRPAAWAIYRHTKGYPRQIIHLCHHTLIIMASRQSQTMRRKWVKQYQGEQGAPNTRATRRLGLVFLGTTAAAAVFLVTVFGSSISLPPGLNQFNPSGKESDFLPARSEFAFSPSPHVTAGLQPSGLKKNVPQVLIGEKKEPGKELLSQTEPHSGSTNAEHSQKTPNWPQELGTIPLFPQDSIWNLAGTVYNTRNSEFKTQDVIPAIRQANPQLKDLGRLKPQTPIRLPLLPGLACLAPRQCRLSLFHTPDLSTCYARYKELKSSWNQSDPSLQFLALWDHRQGLRFHLLAGPGFEGPTQAEQARKDLPARARDDIRILDWTGNNIRPVIFSSLSKNGPE
ncbi:MAG: AAA family ATPase [Desulfovermiculus sp.]|nr:AAA family ATPase [Desulfovermiculus sp.]